MLFRSITQLANGLPSVVAAINTLQAGSADGGELLSGPAAPTAGDGANGDFWLDTSTNDLYGPKENGAWPATTVSFSEQILSGIVAPLSTLGKVNDYYFDSAKKELYGPKTASGWGVPTSLGEADYQNVLFVKPNGIDMKGGTIIVGGDAGAFTGFMMQRGRIIVLGDVGINLGDSMYDGTIFIGGKIGSFGSDAVTSDLTSSDKDMFSTKKAVEQIINGLV